MESTRLTPRQREIIAIIAEGKQNRDIADKLGISVETVKQHVALLLRRLDCTNRTQLAVWWVKEGATQ